MGHAGPAKAAGPEFRPQQNAGIAWFLGYRVFPTHRLMPKENVRRFRRRVRGMQQDYAVRPGKVWVGHWDVRKMVVLALLGTASSRLGFTRWRVVLVSCPG